jgi:acyl-CoA thioesterase FadM
MHMLYRTLMHLFLARRMSKIDFADVSVSEFRVTPTDLDILNHMNNGKYLSILDVARQTLIVRNGIMDLFTREGWAPVVAASTTSYRKSLRPWMKFRVESRIIGFDDQAAYIEQRFVRPDADGVDEIYARTYVRGRFIKRSGGVVKIADLLEKAGVHAADFEVPPEVLSWGQLTRLPSTRAAAPSIWR